MRDNIYLDNICMEIYTWMYDEVEPITNLKDLIASGEVKKHNWYSCYYLPIDRQLYIINYVCNKYRCNKNDREKIMTHIMLGASPNSIKS